MKTTLPATSALSLACALALSPTSAPAEQIWEQRYDGPGHGHDLGLAIASDGRDVIVTGISLNANGDYDIYTAKYDGGAGHLIWEQRYDGPNHADDFAAAVAVDSAGNVIVAGYLAVANAPTDTGHIFINTEFAVLKYRANGDFVWARVGPDHGSLNNDRKRDGIKLAVDRSGNVIVTGYAPGVNEGAVYYTAKYGPNGDRIWETRHHGSYQFGNDAPYAVAVDPSDNVIVTGRAQDNSASPGNANYYTVKYAAADGTVLWEQTYDGPNLPSGGMGNSDVATALAVDSTGNVAVTGRSQVPTDGDPGVAVDYLTIKYAAADGHPLWLQRYDGPNHGLDVPEAIAMDGAGNVVVTGVSSADSGYGNVDYYTAKYAAADGHLLWEQRYDDCRHGGDWAKTVSVDESGNVFVTGTSAGATSSDFYTVGYAANNGSILWSQRSSPLAYEEASGLVLDSAGGAIVTGWSDNPSGNVDIYTARYSPAGSSSPSIQCPANLVTAADPGQCTAVVNFAVSAIDDDCNTYPVRCSPASGSSFSVGTTTVNCSISDAAQCSFTVTVTENEPPTISYTANVVVHPPCGQTAMVVNYPAPSANDRCSSVNVTCNPPSGSVFPAGTTTVQCTAHDTSGNEASCSFTVTVDTTSSTFQFIGFLPPLGGADGSGGSFADPLQAFKLKSTIPVKFKATCAGALVLTGIHTLQAIKYSNQTTSDTPIDATPTEAATTGNQFRLTGDEWHFNLDTKATGMSTGVWLLRATLSDGSQHSAWIQIK